MEKLFKLKHFGTNIKTEFLGGTTTFLTMAYIIFVNPLILSIAGMDRGAVFTATILASIVGTLIMGLWANLPFAIAPGMGLNAFFVFTVVFLLGFSWQQALAMVFLCGVINMIVTVTKVRKMVIFSIPKSLQYAISGGIGLFIAYIGIKQAGFLNFTAEAPSLLVPLDGGGGVFADVIPALTHFTEPVAQVAAIGLAVTVGLMLMGVKSAILLGILATTVIGIPFGITSIPTLSELSFRIPSMSPTFLALDFRGLFAADRIFLTLTTIFAFALTDMFDTIGTFIGAGRSAGIFQEENDQLGYGTKLDSRLEKGLFADMVATSAGALFGTSNATTYIESAAGVSQGARTGLASVVTSFWFAVALFMAPIALMIPGAATAPALIVVGILMADNLRHIRWDDFAIAVPAFLTLVMMPLSYSITHGIALGFIAYVFVKIVKRKTEEVHPIFYVFTALFVLSFIATAML